MASNYPRDRNRKRWNKPPSWAVAEGRKQRRNEKKRKTPSGSTSKLSLGEISDLIQLESNDLAKILDRDLKRFQQSLDATIKESDKTIFIEAIIQIMSKVSLTSEDCKDSSNTVMAEFLSTRCSKFHLELKQYVQTANVERSLTIIGKLCDFCKVVIESFRDQAYVLPISELAELSLPLNLSAQMESLVVLQKEIGRLQRQKQTRDNLTVNCNSTLFENWDNSKFRQMSVLPTVDEIVGRPPPLRSNIIRGSYTGWEHYYDIQFRLLREDFVAPLRKGILEFCSPNRTQRVTNVYIYNNARILNPVCTHEGLCYDIKIDLRGLNLRQSLEHTKRLLFGSLLCFSPDHFKNVIYFGIVTNRIPHQIRRGIFQVKFEESLEMLPHVNKTTFVVAESRAFFEASRHVLRSLQIAEVETMPFSRYLVLNQPLPVNQPKYLDLRNANYNLRAVYENESPYQGKVSILEHGSWPNSNDPGVELDQSQLDAIKMALTQEIAVIQGPPGTGKTYIGYKIVQALLENRNVWDPHKTSPILIMCFTNHALDQFLEGIIHHKIQGSDNSKIKRVPKIVRIGGRSKSEEIQAFSLRNMRRHLVPRHMYREVQQMKSKCNGIGSHITWSITQLKEIIQDPVHCLINRNLDLLLKLKQYIHPSHFYQITQLPEKDDEMWYALEIWLGLRERKPIIPGKQETIAVVHNDGMNNFSTKIENESDEENRITVKGEAELEEENRKLEMDDYSPLKATETVSKIKDDKLTRFIKSRSKQKQQRLQGTKMIYKWVRISEGKIKTIQDKIREAEPMEDYIDDELILNVADSSFTMEQRYQLLRLWIKKYEEHLKPYIQRDIREYDRTCRSCKEADQKLDQMALEHAEVIGMTTTGAAKYQHIIHLVKPKIVIVEEAAELLESHIVSALNAGTQHLILIGDHKQLRPKPNEYDLAMKHNLHISLFERLILNDLPHATLMIQHRMRPQIASLVHPHIYKELIDHESVTRYEKVKGFRKNMYFFHHEEKEDFNPNLLSHSNEYEANFIVGLCRHLLKLGYMHSQMTVLTAYSGQLLKVMNKMPKSEFEGLKITNVDNFQGEENDIIILSLVRNNDNGSVGFLKEENRVCVALSRARKGLYCFGNFNRLLRIQVPIWDSILSPVEAEGCLGSSFPLQCPNHDDVTFEVIEPNGFAKYAPEGGCGRDCKQRLDCGHTCRRLCHGDDLDHQAYRCKEPCTKRCERDEHRCSDYCYQDPCPPCKEIVVRINPSCKHEQSTECRYIYGDQFDPCTFPVTKFISKCGHIQKMMCSEEPEYFQCLKKCGKTLCANDNHKCQKKCWENCGKCEIIVQKNLLNCSHSVELPCHYDPSSYTCIKPCSKVYKCGHSCPKKCGESCDIDCMKLVPKVVPKCGHVENIPCSQNLEHWSCHQRCKKILKCGHSCNGRCGTDCLLYQCREPQKLLLPCKHIKIVECQYKKETQRKIENSEQILCSEECGKQLKCGHVCKNKCYEPCSSYMCKEIIQKKCPKRVHTITAMCAGETSLVCEKSCLSKLPCGHSCTNKCWEECNTSCNNIQIVSCPCGHEHGKKCGNESTCDCQSKCQAVLECGHNCSGNCGDCFSSRIHVPCPFEIYVKRFCGHYASVPCFGLEDKCTKPCQVASCLHTSSPCKHKCYESRKTKCTEPCQYECTHNKCTKLCSEECNVHPCSKPCEKMLDCGHQCLGLCGEKCLSVCLHCNQGDFRSSVRGIDKQKSSVKELQLSKYIQLSCEHMFTVDFLDKCYKQVQGQDRLVAPLLCPTCQKITVCSRYIKICKEKQQDIDNVRSEMMQMQSSDVKILSLSEKHQHLQNIIAKLGMQANFDAIEEAPHPQTFMDKIGIHAKFGENHNWLHLLLNIFIEIGKLCKMMMDTDLKQISLQLFKQIMSIVSREDEMANLSLQLINDIRREVYRISLLYMVGKVKQVLKTSSVSFNDVMKFIDQTETNNSCLNEQVYKQLVAILKQLFELHSPILQESLTEPVDIAQISCPEVTKGQWYRCAKAGHYYFVHAKYRTGKTKTSCKRCTKMMLYR